MLIAFNVVNVRNEIVRAVWNLFLALTEPFLRPIRKFLLSSLLLNRTKAAAASPSSKFQFFPLP